MPVPREVAGQGALPVRAGRLSAPWDEHAGPTHVTASGIVVGRRGTVLHRHKRLGIWMQPGGHIDAGESAPTRLRCARPIEELGLAVGHPPAGPFLIHLDVHEAAHGHTHLDLRYLLLGAESDPMPPPDESPDARWCSWDEALAMADPGADRRAARGAGRLRGDGVTDDLVAACSPSRTSTRPSRSSSTGAPRCASRRAWPAVEGQLAALEAERADATARRAVSLPRPRRTSSSRSPSSASAGAVLSKRMYASTSSSGRDLQAMNDEVRHLTDRRAGARGARAGVHAGPGPHRRRVGGIARAGRAAARGAGDRAPPARRRRRSWRSTLRWARRSTARAAEAALLPTALSDRYETLRARLKGTGAARLVGTHCDGCHLELSSGEVEKIRALLPARSPRASSAAGSSSRPDWSVTAMLILVRHGESVANAQGLLLGRTDAELTDTGRAQAQRRACLL